MIGKLRPLNVSVDALEKVMTNAVKGGVLEVIYKDSFDQNTNQCETINFENITR